MADVSIRTRLEGVDDVQNGLSRLESKLGGVSNAAGSASSGLSTTGAVVAGFVGGLAGGLVVGAIDKVTQLLYSLGPGSLQAAMESERAQIQVRSSLEATGFVAGKTEAQLTALAEALSMKTGFDDEAIKLAEAQLLSFTNVVGSIFTKAIELSTDLAIKMGTDVPSAARTLGLALENPERGARALRAANVVLSESETDLIKKMMDAGDILGAQELLLNRVQNAVGGLAESSNTGLTGAVKRLTIAWGEFQETLGQGRIVQAVTITFLEQGAGLLEKWKTILTAPGFIEGLKEYFSIGTPEARDAARAGGRVGGVEGMSAGKIKRNGMTSDEIAEAAVQQEAMMAAEIKLGEKNAKWAAEQAAKREQASKSAIESMRSMRDAAKEQLIAFEQGDAAALKYSLAFGSLSDNVKAGGAATRKLADEIIALDEKLSQAKLASKLEEFFNEDMLYRAKQISEEWRKMDEHMAFAVSAAEFDNLNSEVKDLAVNSKSLGGELQKIYRTTYGDGKKAFLEVGAAAKETKPWIEDLKNSIDGFSKDLATNLVNSLNAAGSAMDKFKSIVNDVMNSSAAMVTKRLITDPLSKAVGGILDSVVNSFSSSDSGGGYTGGIDFSGGGVDFSGPGIQLPGFANGGNFTVGGVGGIDSQKVSFKATPGEKVSVSSGKERADGTQVSVTINAVDAAGVAQLLMNNQNLIVGMVDRAFNKQGKRGTRG